MLEIGVDIEDINRFEKYSPEKDSAFLDRIFTKKEIDYCFSNKTPARHFAARFCAKEAFYKAVSELGISFKFNELEILNDENGKPYMVLPKQFKNIQAKVSLSHDKTKAIATVLVIGE